LASSQTDEIDSAVMRTFAWPACARLIVKRPAPSAVTLPPLSGKVCVPMRIWTSAPAIGAWSALTTRPVSVNTGSSVMSSGAGGVSPSSIVRSVWPSGVSNMTL
jgi:hypothetical protein